MTRRSLRRSYLEYRRSAVEAPGLRAFAATIPTVPSTVNRYFEGYDELVRATERTAQACFRLDAGTQIEAGDGLLALVAWFDAEPGLRELLLDYDQPHAPWPTSCTFRILGDDGGPRVLTDTLGALAHHMRCQPPGAAFIDPASVVEIARILRAASVAATRSDPVDLPAEDELIQSTADLVRHADRDRLTNSLATAAVQLVVGTGRLRARALAQRAGVSLDSLYSRGGPAEFADVASRALISGPHGPDPDPTSFVGLSRSLVAFGQRHTEFFEFVARKGDHRPGIIDGRAAEAIDQFRSEGRLDTWLPGPVVASIGIGAVVRRFRNRSLDPEGWAQAGDLVEGLITVLFRSGIDETD